MKAQAALILVFLALWTGNRLPAAPQQAQASEASADYAEADVPPDKPAMPALAATPFFTPVLPVPKPSIRPETGEGVRWGDLSRASARFLAIEHGFRLLTEPGTREGLKGPFLRNYGRSVANLHGWADGDEFYVNYVGHPMQGSVAGYLWVQNDTAYRRAEFGAGRLYWKSRLRAAAFIWGYSTQFEIGPLSEASIGAIQSLFPQQGFVDHVITPSIGMAWMIGEDAVDRYIIEPIEAHTGNRWLRLAARSTLNPTRTFANVLNGRVPWSRDTRLGVLSYVRPTNRRVENYPLPTSAPSTDYAPSPPFEFALTFQPERFWGGGKSLDCLGGGGAAAFRIAPSWQLVADIGGCKMIGLGNNLSGDSLTYAVGPRWLTRIGGPWNAHLQVLVGGNKITEERLFPEVKKTLEAIAIRDNKPPPSHGDFTEETESHGFALSTGGGVSYQLNKALTIRLADLSYRHNWTGPVWGRDYGNSLKFSSGLVLHMGTW